MSGAPPTRPSRLRRGLRVAAESLLAAGLVGALSVIGFGGSAEERPRETASLGAVPYMSSASVPTPVEAALRAARRERGAQAERRRAEEARARRAASPAPPTGRGVPPARSSTPVPQSAAPAPSRTVAPRPADTRPRLTPTPAPRGTAPAPPRRTTTAPRPSPARDRGVPDGWADDFNP